MIEEHKAGDGSLLAHYRYADRLISLETSVTVQFYHHDALGSTVDLTDKTGAVIVAYWLDPWGHIRKQEGESVNRQVFTGQEHDEKTGLVYFGSRYFDPDTARFITQDVYLGEQGTPPSLHRYLYAYSNPTVYVDFDGHKSNRELLGLDEKSIQASVEADGGSIWGAVKFAAKATVYKVWNGMTGGFVERQDARQEKLDRGQISNNDFWTGTGIDATISIGSQVAGGGVASKVAGKVVSATGSSFVANTLAGGVSSGFSSAVEQSGQVLTYQVTDGKLGQEKIDYGQIAESVGSGMVVAGGLHVAGEVAERITDRVKAARINGKAGSAPALTGENPTANLPINGQPNVNSINAPKSKLDNIEEFDELISTFSDRSQFKAKSQTHGNIKTSDTDATLYGKFDKDDNFLKWGKSQDADVRYSSKELDGGYLKQYRTGPTDQILDRERKLVERFPGPENNEPWAGWKKPSHPKYRRKK